MTLLKKLLYAFYIHLKARLKEGRRWRHRPASGKSCHLFYGYEHLPRSDERASGGIVKCQDLQRIFPNHLKGANILYLISSALPQSAALMVRYARKNGVKLVWNQNGVAYAGWHGTGWENTNRVMCEIIRQADYVIYQSKFCKISADRFLGRIEKDWTILHNPVDTKKFVPGSTTIGGFNILLAGSHHHFYRVRVAIEMLRQLLDLGEEVRLTIAGRYLWKAPGKDAIDDAAKLAADLCVSPNIQFRGEYNQQEVVDLMQQSDMLLHTKYNDPCPRVVVEALACGLPIVYSKSGGVAELVGEKAGIGIASPLDWEQDHPPSPVQLAEATSRIMHHYDSFSDFARKRAVEHLDIRPWLTRHGEIFNSILK